MRLERYINESFKIGYSDIDQESDFIIKNIEKDCKQYLREFKNSHPLMRGTNKINQNNIFDTVKPRQDRKPKDTSLDLHVYLDDLFKKQFGWKPRSQGVFVARNYGTAMAYGDVAVIFPIGSYQYIWNPNIDDLYSEIGGLVRDIKNEYMGDPEYMDDYDIEDFPEYSRDVDDETLEFPPLQDAIQKMVSGYTNKGYHVYDAGKRKHEAMFKMREYYALYFETINGKYKQSVNDIVQQLGLSDIVS